MCKSPKLEQTSTYALPAVQLQDEAGKQAADNERKKRRSQNGYQSTILAGKSATSINARPALKTELGG